MLPWFVLTHARATENQPIVTFVPGPDRADAELAEVLDIAMKSLWFETGMEDVHDRLMAWVIAAGRATSSRASTRRRGRCARGSAKTSCRSSTSTISRSATTTAGKRTR
jgi:hypothetical protein